MRKPVALLSMLLVLGFCLTAVAPFALAADMAPPPEPPGRGHAAATITWTPVNLNVPIAAGDTQTVHASFSSSMDITNAQLAISFPLSRFVTVAPADTFNVTQGAPNDIAVMIEVPEDVQGNAGMVGTIQVTQGGRTFALPLIVTLQRAANARPPIDWTPDRVNLTIPSPTPTPATSTDPTPTPTPGPETAVVHFTTQVAITGAHLRATPMLDRVLDLSQVGPLDLVPGVTYELQLTAHLPTGMDTDAIGAMGDSVNTASDGQGRGPVARVVSGEIQVFSGERVYPHNLPVRVEFSPVAKQPVMKWSPPVATMFVPLGAAQSRVVTLTSDIAVSGASLQVTGAIAPFVTAAPETAGPLTIAAATPLRIVLTATTPASALINRPYLGEVVVVGADGTVYRHELKVILMWRPAPTS